MTCNTYLAVDEPNLLRDDGSVDTAREFIVDREGEMPTIIKSPSPLSALAAGSVVANNQRTLSPFQTFQAYDTGEDEVPRTTTPDPIKVTRSKKKGTGKKRTSKT